MNEFRFCPRCAGPMEPRAVDQPDVRHPVCASCGFVLWQNLKASVEGLIVRAGSTGREVLLGRTTGQDLWDAPGGFLNVGDTIERALLRECKRELGVLVRVARLVGVYEQEFAGGLIVSIFYECAHIGGDPVPGVDFIDEARWFSLSSPAPPLAFESVGRALEQLRADRSRGSAP